MVVAVCLCVCVSVRAGTRHRDCKCRTFALRPLQRCVRKSLVNCLRPRRCCVIQGSKCFSLCSDIHLAVASDKVCTGARKSMLPTDLAKPVTPARTGIAQSFMSFGCTLPAAAFSWNLAAMEVQLVLASAAELASLHRILSSTQR